MQLIKERAEWDKQEREALENLKMTLETEKRKIEEELEGERVLNLDKDALLERSKRREAELEEEVVALQADLDTLDSQLDRALKIQRESEEKNETLRLAFDQAADHLVRLESQQQEWASKEADLTELVAAAQQELEVLCSDKEELQKVSEELTSLVSEREEDVARMKERMEATVTELEAKLSTELRDRSDLPYLPFNGAEIFANRDLIKDKSAGLAQDARHAREQLAEMARTATQYSTIIQKKDDDIARLVSDLALSKREREQSLRQITELQADIDTLVAELETQKYDRDRNKLARAKLQEELDELRALMDAKTSEETRRSEAEKSKEQELTDLRGQVSKLQSDLNAARKLGIESQSKLKVELDNSVRALLSLQENHSSLAERERAAQGKLAKADAALSDAEKVKRTLESELQSVRSRQIDTDSRLGEVVRVKEVGLTYFLHRTSILMNF